MGGSSNLFICEIPSSNLNSYVSAAGRIIRQVELDPFFKIPKYTFCVKFYSINSVSKLGWCGVCLKNAEPGTYGYCTPLNRNPDDEDLIVKVKRAQVHFSETDKYA
jgi:hypothetical protein